MFYSCIALVLAILLIPCVGFQWVAPRLKSRWGLVFLCWLVIPAVAIALTTALDPAVTMYQDFNRQNHFGIGPMKMLSATVLYCLPVLLAMGMGSAVRHSILGMALAWFLTPWMMGLITLETGYLVSFYCENPNVHPMGRMPIAFHGVLTGIISGVGSLAIRIRQNPAVRSTSVEV